MKQFSNEKGFTLVEILVVIFTIVLLTGIMLFNYQKGKGRFALQRSTNQLAQDLRRVEEMGISTKEFNGEYPAYGIYLDTSTEASKKSYILFADSDGGLDYDGAIEMIEEINLEEGVEILQLIHSDSAGAESDLDIIFKPPDPTVIIDEETGREARIYLEGAGEIKLVRINSIGLIEIDSGDNAVPDCYCEWKNTSWTDDICSDPYLNCDDDIPPMVYWDCFTFTCFCSPTDCCVAPDTCPDPSDEYPKYSECISHGDAE